MERLILTAWDAAQVIDRYVPAKTGKVFSVASLVGFLFCVCCLDCEHWGRALIAAAVCMSMTVLFGLLAEVEDEECMR